jgi:pyruvate formate lyase activating enzyme
LIRSIVGTSLIEYPGRICAVLFTGGCNLACPFCHNPELVLPDLLDKQFSITADELILALGRRRGFIDAVALTGGEPLFHDGTIDLLQRIRRDVGLMIKLDTNGTFPDRLEKALPLVDYIAMDLKSSPAKYPLATGGHAAFEDVRESIELVKSAEDYEFRTTMVPELVTPEDVMELLSIVSPVKRYVLQQFRPGKTLAKSMNGVKPYNTLLLEDVADDARIHASEVLVRI